MSGIGAEYARKETGFLTSCKHIWQTLDGKCGNLIRGDWHRHKREPEAEAHSATVYPPKMVAAVLRSLRAEHQENDVISSMDAIAGRVQEMLDEYRGDP